MLDWLFRTRLAACTVCVVIVWVRLAGAHELSEFEQEVQAAALSERGWTLDEAPDGKWIESIDVHVVEPFDERDPIPELVNVLHVRSRDYVVKRELTLVVGTRLDEANIDDSLNNLRSTQKFSLVLIAAARGRAPDSVRLLVVVKDVWSLRLAWDIEVVNKRLNKLLLNPTEVNLLGTHTTLGALYLLEPDRHTFGGTLFIPQVGHSNLGLVMTGGPIVARDGFEPEGSYGYFQYYQPLKSRHDRWSWSVGMGWRDEVTRRYTGVEIRRVAIEAPDGSVEIVPEVFNTDRLAGEYELTRSFGSLNKTDFSLGVEADRRAYRTQDLSAYSAYTRRVFERYVLPTTDTRISPFVQVLAYSSAVQRLVNVDTLSLQEDFPVGHSSLLRLYPASRGAGSSRTLMGVDWAVGYSLPLGTGLVAAKTDTTIELARANQNDVLFNANVRFVSPNLGPGRFHFGAIGYDRYRNYLNIAPLVLGGENRLRGYEFSRFQGDKLVALNAEFRSVPFELLGAHFGGVCFYDAGDANDDIGELSLKQSVGLGARVLLPQFDRVVFRLDWGMPLTQGFRGFPGGVVLTFGQALSFPTVMEPSVLSDVLPE